LKAWSRQGTAGGRCAASAPAEWRGRAPLTPAPHRTAARCARWAPRRGFVAGAEDGPSRFSPVPSLADGTRTVRGPLAPTRRCVTLGYRKAVPGRRFAAAPASSSSPS